MDDDYYSLAESYHTTRGRNDFVEQVVPAHGCTREWAETAWRIIDAACDLYDNYCGKEDE